MCRVNSPERVPHSHTRTDHHHFPRAGECTCSGDMDIDDDCPSRPIVPHHRDAIVWDSQSSDRQGNCCTAKSSSTQTVNPVDPLGQGRCPIDFGGWGLKRGRRERVEGMGWGWGGGRGWLIYCLLSCSSFPTLPLRPEICYSKFSVVGGLCSRHRPQTSIVSSSSSSAADVVCLLLLLCFCCCCCCVCVFFVFFFGGGPFFPPFCVWGVYSNNTHPPIITMHTFTHSFTGK